MADFRKWIMALVAVTLLLSMTGIASAQSNPVNCVANSGNPPLLRAEGLAEIVGDVLIICTGGDPTAGTKLVNFDIFLNTNVTSDIQAGVSEGLIMLNEPQPGAQHTTPSGTIVNVNADDLHDYNIWTAQRTTGFENRLTWNGIPFDAPGTQGQVIYRITNVRANATQLPTGQFIPSSVSMFINISPQGALPLSNPQQIVGTVLPSLSFSSSAAAFKQCEEPSQLVDIHFTELFATAFKKRIETIGESSTDETYQDVPGAIYQTESGFTPSDHTLDITDVGVADTGTRFLLRFSNVPSGVDLTLPVTVNSTGYDETTSIFLQKITGWNVNYAGGTDDTTGVVDLDSTGAGAALYEVRGMSGINGSSITDDFVIEGTVAFTPGTVSLGTATVNGNYAPINATAVMSGPAPEPRFLDSATDKTFLSIAPCRTLLLFPFVTNQAGFDTGLAISNTSEDPFGTIPQTGACTLYYYGNTAGGGAAPAPQTSEQLAGGDHMVGSLSSGGTHGLVATPGFQGYVIAICDFQFAHGYAFISDVGATKLAQGYLALIIPDKKPSSSMDASQKGFYYDYTLGLRSPEAFSYGASQNDGEQLVH